MKVKVYCGCFVGPSYWHGTEIFEPDECCWEDVIDVDEQEWEDGAVSGICPECGAELFQGDGHFEEFDEHPEWNTFIRYAARARGQ